MSEYFSLYGMQFIHFKYYENRILQQKKNLNKFVSIQSDELKPRIFDTLTVKTTNKIERSINETTATHFQ